MTEHLIVSTIVLGLALLAARFLPLNARTRYALLLVALAKFAVPTAVFRFVPVEAVPEPLRVFGGGPAAAAPAAQTGVEWVPLVWGTIALLLFGRWALLRARTIAAALRSATPASQREVDAVRDARAAMKVAVAVDVVRSPVCEAPAVLRVVRPVIALPSSGCDALGDDELRSLVLHECAHVARQDNLAAAAQAVATSLLWFHPLVWIASRAITAAREQACDERVAEAMRGTDAYLAALAKICRLIAAPRTAGASCMAGANLKQRMEKLMHYDTVSKRPWLQRSTLAACAMIVAVSTVALAGPAKKSGSGYAFQFQVSSPNGREVQYDFTIRDKASGRVLAQPRAIAQPNQEAVVRSEHESGAAFHITASGTKERATIRFEVREGGAVVHSETFDHTAAAATEYSGQPISINVKSAELRDLMKTFSQLTGLEIEVAENAADTRVTMEVVGMPWDQALDEIARTHGLKMTIEGKTIRVTK